MASNERFNSFRAVFGVLPGYDNTVIDQANFGFKSALATVTEAWDRAACEVEATHGLYIPAVLNESRTVYKREWRCPPGGEVTVTVAGTRNPTFVSDERSLLWWLCVRRTVEVTKELLRQTTVTLEFLEARVEYFTSKPAGETG